MNREKKGLLAAVLNYRGFGLLIALAVLLAVAAVVTPAFFSFDSVASMLTNNAVYAILAVGAMFVLLTGGIDISVGSILAVSGITVTRLMTAAPSVPAVVWVVLGLLIGALCGLVNGWLVGKLRIVPLIVTLGTMYVFRGLAFVISGGEWIFPHQFTASFTDLAQRRFLGLNVIVWWSILLFVLTGLYLGYCRSGRRLYAVGTREMSAVIAGIRADRVKVLAYTLCGGCAGLAGVLYSAQYAMINSEMGLGYEMTAIAICILGGVSITGGRGRIDGVVIASLLMSVATYLLSLLPGFSVWQDALKGAIILIAVAVNLVSGRLSERRARRERGRLI